MSKLMIALCWIPIIGIIPCTMYKFDYNCPVQTHTILNAMIHGFGSCVLLVIIIGRLYVQ